MSSEFLKWLQYDQSGGSKWQEMGGYEIARSKMNTIQHFIMKSSFM